MGANDMIAQILNPAMIDQAWPSVAPFLQDAVDASAGEMSLESIKRRIEDETTIAICMTEEDGLYAVGILEKVTFPSSKSVLGISCLGGVELDRWVNELDKAVTNIAREQDCTEVRIIGRPGWLKALKELGWGSTHTILSKRT